MNSLDRNPRDGRVRVWLALVPSLALALPCAADGTGIVVEQVRPGSRAEKAGLQPGDVLTSWERGSSPSSADGGGSRRGTLVSPLDLDVVEQEQLATGEITLRGTRAGATIEARIADGVFGLVARAPLAGRELELYEDGQRRLSAREYDPALAAWNEAALAARARGDHATAAWMFQKAGWAAAENQRWPLAEKAFLDALQDAEAHGDVWMLTFVQTAFAYWLEQRGQWPRAVEQHRGSIERLRRTGSGSVTEARNHVGLGWLAFYRGDMAGAEEHARRAQAILESCAPRSRVLSRPAHLLGGLEHARGNFVAALEHGRRALEIEERVNPRSMAVAGLLRDLGGTVGRRGDLAAAEDWLWRSLAMHEELAPHSVPLAMTLTTLGEVARNRGDAAAAEDHYRRALAILEKAIPDGLPVARNLNSLAGLATERGDLSAADEYGTRALAIAEKIAPRSVDASGSLKRLASIRLQRGNLAEADELARRAAAIQDAVASSSAEASDTARLLGDVALARGDLAAAYGHYERCRAIRAERMPGTGHEAEALQRLAALHRRRGESDAALDHYRRALDTLEGQREALGGTDEAKSAFSAQHSAYYRELLHLLIELGRREEAFHVLERQRARAFLTRLAERDLVFSRDVSPELDRQRREANAEYDRALAALTKAADAEIERGRETLRSIRTRQAVIEEKIRSASPRLAALKYPQPLDLAATRAALDPGTLLLSYSIAEGAGYVFAVGPAAGDFTVAALDVQAGKLRDDVGRFLRLSTPLREETSLDALQALSRELGAALLGPVREHLGRAERVLVVPDGPLHLLPFAALGAPGPGSGFRYLVEAVPIHVAASATVFAELKKLRDRSRSARLVAFGDPVYSPAGGASAAPDGLRSMARRGLELGPLPHSRREVEDLALLYPKAADVHLGASATEEAAKRVDRATGLLHFACHALADESSPLDSALALTIPGEWTRGRENGLLQAWEVIEQMRVDADLVVLSACSTALGKEMSGEGLLGLTRAFQFAGARSVLASQWPVIDRSTAELMKHFHRALKAGRTKDAALREAQLALLRGPSTSHPVRWAAFQLVGDWK